MSAILPIQQYPALRGGLEANSTPLPLEEQGSNGWATGVQLTPLAGGVLFVYGCGSLFDKPINEAEATVEFESFQIGTLFECGVNGGRGVQGDIAKQLAQSLHKRARWGKLAAVLVEGDVDAGDGDPNPNFGDAEFPDGFNPATPGDIRGSLQGLLDGISTDWHASPLFHANISLLPYLLGDLVHWSEAEGRYKLGEFDFSFDEYPNHGSESVEADTPTADDGTEFWIWATGPIYTAWAAEEDVTVDTVQLNEHVVRVEQGAIAVFDPSFLRAVKVRVA